MSTTTREPFSSQALKVGVMGGAGEGIAAAHLRLAEYMEKALAEAGGVLITGGCPGLPLAAARNRPAGR